MERLTGCIDNRMCDILCCTVEQLRKILSPDKLPTATVLETSRTTLYIIASRIRNLILLIVPWSRDIGNRPGVVEGGVEKTGADGMND